MICFDPTAPLLSYLFHFWQFSTFPSSIGLHFLLQFITTILNSDLLPDVFAAALQFTCSLYTLSSPSRLAMKTLANISPAELLLQETVDGCSQAQTVFAYLYSFVWTIFLTAANKNVMPGIRHTEFKSYEYLSVLPSAEGLLPHKEADWMGLTLSTLDKLMLALLISSSSFKNLQGACLSRKQFSCLFLPIL